MDNSNYICYKINSINSRTYNHYTINVALTVIMTNIINNHKTIFHRHYQQWNYHYVICQHHLYINICILKNHCWNLRIQNSQPIFIVILFSYLSIGGSCIIPACGRMSDKNIYNITKCSLNWVWYLHILLTIIYSMSNILRALWKHKHIL